MTDQQVAEEPGLVKVPQPDHVVHALHRGGVHGLEADALTDLVLLRTNDHSINMTSAERKDSPDVVSHLSLIVRQV